MRSEFLAHWSAYPDTQNLPGDCVFGQLNYLDLYSGIIKLYSQGKIKSFELLPGTKVNESLIEPEMLCGGDKLAVQINDKQQVENVWLLAPNLNTDYKTISSQVLAWYEFLQKIRGFFIHRKFIETPTPNLVLNPGMEPHLQAFKTQCRFGSAVKDFYLPTSPEIHLKKLLSQGLENIFEIKACFRNEENTPIHSAEFTMLEWYRAYVGLDKIAMDIQDLLCELTGESIGIKKLHLRNFYESAFDADWSEVFDYGSFKKRASEHGFSSKDLTWNDLFSWFQVSVVEPQLQCEEQPILLFGFPDLQPSLARSQNGESERFELYWKGVELANAYHELNDPKVQRQRWLKDQAYRAKNGLEVYELDEEFLQSLEQGMPPSSGIALGLERLFMVLNGIQQIKELSPFQEKY